MTGVFAAIVLLLHALWWIAVVLIGLGICLAIPAAIVAFIVSQFIEPPG